MSVPWVLRYWVWALGPTPRYSLSVITMFCVKNEEKKVIMNSNDLCFTIEDNSDDGFENRDERRSIIVYDDTIRYHRNTPTDMTFRNM